jgi:hypothetical protein
MTDDLETRLRDHGTAWRAAHPPAPEVDEARLAGRRLPLRSLALVAAGVAVVAAGTLLVIPRNHNAARVTVGAPTGVVPWKDDPVVYPPTTTTTVSPYPVCRARDLRPGTSRRGAAAGTGYWGTTITNAGASPCTLPLDLAPGEQGEVMLGAPDVCYPSQTQPSRRFTSVVVAMPDGTIALSGIELMLCVENTDDSVLASFMTDRPVPGPSPAAPGTVGTLAARIDTDPVLRAGTTATFVVVLANPTDVDVALDPCPSYAESIGEGDSGPFAYRLNCDTVHHVSPHAEVRFEMRLRIPTTIGRTKFGWQLLPDGPSAGLPGGVAEIVP